MVSVPRGETSLCVPKWVASEALLSGLVLNLPIDERVAEIGDLGDEQKVVATERLALVPLALLGDLAALVGLVVVPPEPVDGDVIHHLAAREPVGPHVSSDVTNLHHANRFVLALCGCRVSAAVALLRVAIVEAFRE